MYDVPSLSCVRQLPAPVVTCQTTPRQRWWCRSAVGLGVLLGVSFTFLALAVHRVALPYLSALHSQCTVLHLSRAGKKVRDLLCLCANVKQKSPNRICCLSAWAILVRHPLDCVYLHTHNLVILFPWPNISTWSYFGTVSRMKIFLLSLKK